VGLSHRAPPPEVPDGFRGRVFALDFALFSLGFAGGNYLAGYFMDVVHLNPRTIATRPGACLLLPATLWMLSRRPAKTPRL
jgi:MFS family permease